MTSITFDISIRPETISRDRRSFDIVSLDDKGIRNIAEGKLFIVFEPQRDFIVIESEVLDYLVQIRDVISEIDSGNHESFAVSGDWYSNNLLFTFHPDDSILEIYEVNGGRFKIKTSYDIFKDAFFDSYYELLSDLTQLYPELKDNQAFQELCK